MLCVLLTLGTAKQDTMKEAYWLMEIEDYKSDMKMFTPNFADVHDRILQTTCNLIDNRVGMAVDVVCSNPAHATTQKVISTTARVSEYWYSLPEEYNRVKTAEGKWDFVDTAGHHEHTGMADVMQSLLCRSDLKATDCKHCGGSAKVVQSKNPAFALLPKFLRIEGHPGSTVVPEESFKFGGHHYKLLAVTFGDGKHYTSNIRLSHGWYRYDGLGFLVDGTDTQSTRMQIVGSDNSTGYYEPPRKGYSAVAYRYIRMDAPEHSSWTRVTPIDVQDFVTGQSQFQSLELILDTN